MHKPFERVTVAGAGFLGSQIALVAAYTGYTVSIYDVRESAFDESYAKLYSDLQTKTANPLIPWDQWQRVKEQIRFSTNLDEAVKDADLVIEAITENVDAKRKLFSDLGKKASPEAIFASNSSSLPVSRMEESSGRPQRCVNIHFYLPLQGMNMADLMGGTKTLPEVLDAGERWIRSMNFVPLRVNKEALGFCFNNVWRAIKKQTLYMWANGFVDFRDIDRAWCIFTGTKMGPFALMDTIGLDVVYDIETAYHENSQDPADKPPYQLLEKLRKGELGVKTQKGFYTYPDPEFLRPDFLDPNRE